MSNLWCKLWNFVLGVFTSAVEGIGFALKTVGTVLIDVADGVLGAASDALGLSSILPLALIGAGLYLFWPRKNDDKGSDRVVINNPERSL